MFKSTNAHLQLLLFCLHLSFLLLPTHIQTHTCWFLQKYCCQVAELKKHHIHYFISSSLKLRPQYADGSYGWRCITFEEHKRIDSMNRSLQKVLVRSVKSLFSHSPTYQLPYHQLNAIWEMVVCISYHKKPHSSSLGSISYKHSYAFNVWSLNTCSTIIHSL